jgi:hypothetical protein
MKRQFKDLTGKRFGNIEVLSKIGTKGHNNLWKCICHLCKKQKEIISPLLRKTTKSCGCVKTKQNKESPHWKGFGDISKENYNKIVNNAKRRKINFNISIEELWNLFLKQNKCCSLTGKELKFGRYRRNEITASLDRIDSSKGYTIDNVQWVHKDVNMMKYTFSTEYLLELCNNIINYKKETI